MTSFYVEQRAKKMLNVIASDPKLARFIDFSLDIPHPFCGTGEIRLVILGQDPTVRSPRSRARIKTVLNLDRPGSLRFYLTGVCEDLGLDLDRHVYATNYLKNFFVEPPTQIEETDILDLFGPIWKPILEEELGAFPGIPIITLGQPLLAVLIYEGASPRVRDYWGYTSNWQTGETVSFRCLEPDENRLGRLIFPFPHQPSIRKRFYRSQLPDYAAFVKSRLI